MKKILFISDSSSIHTIRWVEALQEFYKIYLLDWRAVDKSFYAKFNNVIVVQRCCIARANFKHISFIATYMCVKRIVRKISPDLIHSHYASSYGLLGARAKKPKLITSIWGTDITDFPHKSTFHRKITKHVLKKSDYVFATSKFLAKETRSLCNKNITITPFGVDFKHSPKKIIEKNSFIFGSAKNITKESGIDTVIKCFHKLVKNNPKMKLKYLVAGEGPFADDIKLLIDKLDIEEHVNLLGKINHNNIIDFYSQIDVYINLPTKEGFGVAVLEASASGKPVIVSNVGGLAEIVLENKTGLIINDFQIENVIKAMETFLFNEQLTYEMGQNGKNFVNEKYNWKSSLQIMKSNYEKILNHED